MEEHAAWLALAYRSGMSDSVKREIALGPGADASDYPQDVIEREAEDAQALADLGVRLIPITRSDS